MAMEIKFAGEAVVVTKLQRRIAETGAKALAEIIGVSYGYLMAVAEGRRHPGDKIGRWVGYECRWEPIRPRHPRSLFARGDAVQKKKGFPFKGIVVSVVQTLSNDIRYVVEHATEVGMLHIYSEGQLEARSADTGEVE